MFCLCFAFFVRIYCFFLFFLHVCSFLLFFFPNSRMLWGLSPHSLRGAPGHCSTLPPRFAGSGNQGSENRFREPGFGARFREPRVPGTRVRGKVPGTQGSANQTFKQGSGNNGFWLPFGFRDVKVPGRFRAHLAFDKVPRTTTDADPQFGYTSWIMPQVPDRDKVRVLARFRGSGNNPGVGYTPWVVPRFMLRTGSQKTNLQGNQGSRTKRARSTSNRWQGGGQRDNKSARLGSGNPGFQYTLWVAPRFRKRGFQEDKVPGTQGSRNTRDSGNPPANLGCFVAGSAHADSCSFAQWAHSVGRLTCSDVAVKSSVWTVPMSHLPKHMPHQAIKFDALEHLNIGSKPVWGFSKPGRWFFEAKWPNSNTQWNFRHSCDTTTKYWHETNSGIMMDNLAKTNCFTNHLRKLTDVVQTRQDNPKPTHTHTQFCKHLMTHRGLQILPFVCNQMYVNSTMRAFLKNMSHPAFGPKGEGARRAKNRRRDLGYGILFLPSLIRLGLQSWTTVWNQPLPVPGTRVPGKVPELRVPGTRVRGKVPGTQGSANQTFKQGSGNNGFWLPFGFRDVKVPGSPGSRRQEGSGHTWLSTRFREPYHGFERFWNHRNTNFETSWKPKVWGTRVPARFQQHWVPTRFREPPRMRTHSLDILPGLCHRFRTGTRLRNNNFQEAQPRFQRTRVLARFRGSGNNPGVGYTPWVVPRFMLRTGSQKTNFQGNQGSRTI